MLRLCTIGLAVFSLALQAPKATITCHAERSTILAGEPLVLVVTVRNLTDKDLQVPTDSDSLQRVTVGPAGIRLYPAPAPFEPDKVTFFVLPSPGEERTFKVLAGETAQLRVPSEYRMTVGYPEFGASTELRFTVSPYDFSALRRRAEEIYGVVLEMSDAGSSLLAKRALTVIEPQVAEPLLCSLLKRNPGELENSLAYRLEELASPAVVDCLTEILPHGRDITQEMVARVLRNIAQRTSDTKLREKIRQVLATK
jgi:hypothetical protein